MALNYQYGKRVEEDYGEAYLLFAYAAAAIAQRALAFTHPSNAGARGAFAL